MIIFLHGYGERGNGSETQLAKILDRGLPKLIKDSLFPSSFNVNGEDFSFIVISPQVAQGSHPDSVSIAIMKLMKYCKSNYRVDPERIYVTGASVWGAQFTWNFVSRADETIPGESTMVRYADSVAAVLPVATYVYPWSVIDATSGNIARVNASNLPLWATHNANDTERTPVYTTKMINNLNGLSPAPTPAARYTLLAGAGHDAWTTTYNPNYILDSAKSYNVYQWMLQYTNKRLVANAGQDIVMALPKNDTVLNGSRSTVRQGRINSITWSKVAGPSTYTITSPGSLTTTLTGLVAGTYQFELKLNHSDGSTVKRDTITITVTGSSSRVASPVAAVVEPATTTDEMLTAKINPTVTRSQVTIVINGKATGKVNLQVSSMDGKRMQRQSFVKDAGSITRTMNVSTLTSGTYIVEVIVAGQHRKILRFIKQ